MNRTDPNVSMANAVMNAGVYVHSDCSIGFHKYLLNSRKYFFSQNIHLKLQKCKSGLVRNRTVSPQKDILMF